jgi:hypothetical protein
MAKSLGLNGSMLGLIATQVLFQSIVAVALVVKSRGAAGRPSFESPPAGA